MIKIRPQEYIFIASWTYYLFLPTLVIFSDLINNPAFPQDLIYYRENYSDSIYTIINLSILALISFIVGSRIKLNKKEFSNNQNNIFSGNKKRFSSLSSILVPFLSIICFAAITSASPYLATGYASVYKLGPIVSFIATLNILLTFHLIVLKNIKSSIKYRTIINSLLVIVNISLLSLGSRVYVGTCIVSLLLDSYSRKNINLKRIFSVFIFIILLFFIAGQWRSGIGISFDINNLSYLFTESFFVYLPLPPFLSQSEISLFDLPVDIKGAFINLIPNFILSDKLSLVMQSSIFNKFDNLSSPLGGLNILASSIANFGLIGSFIPFLLLGIFIERNRIRGSIDPLSQALFCILSGMMCLIFFRDPMQVSVKLFLQIYLFSQMYRFGSYLFFKK